MADETKKSPENKTKNISDDKKNPSKFRFIITNLIRVLLVLAFFGALRNQRWLVFFIAGLALLVTFLPAILNKYFKIKFSAEFEVMVILFIYGTLFFGEVRGFYARFWWWDALLGLVAAIALGLVGFTVLYVLYKDEIIDASPLVIAIFVFSFSFAIGSLWEIFEFGADTFLGFNLQESGLSDTMGDLIVNAIGAFLVSLGGYFYIKNGKINIVSNIVAKFVEKNPQFFKSKRKKDVSSGILDMIKEGEHKGLEFKSTLRTNLHTKETDKNIEHSALKTISAYLNSDGGTLLIGVSDKGEILGIEKDNFPTKDKLSLHLTNLLKQHIGNEFLPFIEFGFVNLSGKHVLKVDCKKSGKHVFMKTGKDEKFYVRNGAATAELSGSSLIDYISHKFGKN